MGMTIDNANKLLSVITSTITEDDDCFTIEDENLQVFKETLLTAIDTMRKYQQLQADYENRLKADMVAMLTDILERIKAGDIKEEKADNDWGEGFIEAWGSANLNAQMVVEEKINALKENKNG